MSYTSFSVLPINKSKMFNSDVTIYAVEAESDARRIPVYLLWEKLADRVQPLILHIWEDQQLTVNQF